MADEEQPKAKGGAPDKRVADERAPPEAAKKGVLQRPAIGRLAPTTRSELEKLRARIQRKFQ